MQKETVVMAVRRTNLYRALRMLASSDDGQDLISRTMELLEPFFRVVETGSYDLCTEQALDHVQVMDAITWATGSKVSCLVLLPIPVGHIAQEGCPDVVSPRFFERLSATLGEGVVRSVEMTLCRRISCRFGEAQLPREIEDALIGFLQEDLWNDLRAVFYRSFRGISGDLLCDAIVVQRCVEETYWTTMFSALASAISGNRARFESLVPLFQLLARFFPFCEDASRPGTWVVLIRQGGVR